MFLTLDTLEQFNACKNGKKWFARNFPAGGELIDVISHKYATPEILHWSYQNLTTTEEEREAYWTRLEINCPDRRNIYESERVTNSEYISKSSDIVNSNYIFESHDISESSCVSKSNSVEKSNLVFDSEFVYNSSQVHHGTNITESINTIQSNYVVRSSSVINSAVVTDSDYIGALAPGRTKNIKNSAFIFECVNINHCLFCSGTSNGEYLLFNQPIDADQFDIIYQQLHSILKGFAANYVENWSDKTVPLTLPHVQNNVQRQYTNLPEKFWRWIVTLPNYDPQILYTIIWQPELLTN